MRKLWIILFIILLFASSSEASWNGYITGARTKYTPSATLPTDSSLSINVVKGQYAAFQVLMQANGEDVSGVNVACTTPVKGGDSLNAPVIYYQKPHNVYIPAINNLITGEYPDPLIPKVDAWYSESRGAFPFNVTRVSTNRIGAGTPLAYPVFGFAIQASASGVFRSNTATTSPTIGGAFSGGAATNYHARIDGAGGIGTATFKWTTNAVHIKYATYVASTTTVIITTYENHGFSVGNTVNITTSRQAYNGDITIVADNVGGDYSRFTYVKNCGTSNLWYEGGGTAIKTWNGTGVAIPTPVAAVALSNDLTITFPDQTPAYAVGDEWEFYANTFRNEMVWVDVYVPTDAVAGTYTATVTVSATSKADITLSLSIIVYNLAISKTSSIPVMYGGAPTHRYYVGYGHQGSITPYDENLIKRYMEAGLRHRISIPGLAGPFGWTDPNITNWSTHSDWIKPYMNGTWADGSAMSIYFYRQQSGMDHAPVIYGGAIYTSVSDLEKRYMESYASNLNSEGWLSKTYIMTAEEPSASARASATAATRMLDVYTSLQSKSAVWKTLITGGYVSAWTSPWTVDAYDPFITTFRTSPMVPTYDDFITAGGEVWSYLACQTNGCNIVGTYSADPLWSYSNRPDMAIDSPATQMIGYWWLMYDNNVHGDLYWATMWPNERWSTSVSPRVDPWDCIYAFGSYGDGTYFYPGRISKIGGTTDIPIESIRLKYVRMGLEDYEIFSLTARDSDTLADIQGAVGSAKWYYASYPPSVSGMETARTNILNRLLGQPPPIVVPTVTTTAMSNISYHTATSGGNVTSAGGGTVSDRGICWNTTTNPVVTDSHTHDANGTGVFVSSMTGLTRGTQYYVRSYAVNETGTSYGENVVFTTLDYGGGGGATGSISIGSGAGSGSIIFQ